MKIDLEGRVRNIRLSASDSLLPLLEAVVNAIHAVEDAGLPKGAVEVRCIRSNEPQLIEIHPAHWANFAISDNGVGFNEANFSSFSTSDSMWKRARGGKGVGRLLWLKAFDQCHIESTFVDTAGDTFLRDFDFELTQDGIERATLVATEGKELGTKVSLIGFREPYRKAAPVSLEGLAQLAFDHCLEYLVLGRAPNITFVEDGGERISLSEMFNESVEHASAATTFDVRNQKLSIQHLRLQPGTDRQHRLLFCANSRPVKSIKLAQRMPNLTSSLSDPTGTRFVYAGYVSGDILNDTVNSERTAFSLPDEASLVFPDEIGWDDVTTAALNEATSFLKPATEPIRESKEARIRSFISEKAPQYKPLLKHRGSVLESLPADISDDRLDLELYKIERDYDVDLREKQSKLLKEIEHSSQSEDFDNQYVQFLEEWNEAGMSKLARHVAYRKATLHFLERNLQLNEAKKYAREEAIHAMIFPLKRTSDDVRADQMNLWIIDERLAFHHYLASDLPLKKYRADVLNSESSNRPDIAIFNRPTAFTEDESPFTSVILLEFKRPSRDDYSDDENPITQILNYTEEITAGAAKDRHGKFMRVPSNLPFYAYILADLTPSLEKQCRQYDLRKTADNLGYFGYQQNYNTYIEVLSFDKVIADSKKRNAKLFEQLGIL
jgi:hypothetical protein